MTTVLTKINLVLAAVVTFFTSIFGIHWWLFAAFLGLNIIDFFTGWAKARYTKVENSNKGAKGIIKKVGYWVIIAIAFFMAYAFGTLGELIGIDLGITLIIGWFTLATFIINEIRSILENCIQLGCNPPSWLVKGLEVANKKINDIAGGDDE